MSEPLFAGDLHLGQSKVCRFRPQFSTVQEHDETIVNNILKEVNKRTTLYLLGDICFKPESLDYIRLIKNYCSKVILIPGNHCTEKLSMRELAEVYSDIHGSLSIYDMWLTHQPIHADHLRGRLCVHGHLHDKYVDDSRYLCVSLEHTLYSPVTLTHIREIYENRIDRGELAEHYRKKLKLGNSNG